MDQDFFKLGVQAARAGDFKTAQTYFVRVVQANPNSEKGWLYLGHCLADPEKRITCYQRVLKLNPYNQEAQKALAALGQPYYPPQESPQEVYYRQPPEPVQPKYSQETNYEAYYSQPEPVQPAAEAQPAPPARAAKTQKSPLNTVMVIIGSVVGLVACLCIALVVLSRMSPKTQAQALPTPTPTPPSLPGLDAASLPAPAAPTGAGRVCLGFWDQGVACLDESGWQTYSTANSELPTDSVEAGIFCPDGRLAIAHYKGISLVQDQQWEQIPELGEGYGMARYLACDKDGQIWAAHYKGVSRYVSGAWQTYNIGLLATVELPNEYVNRIFATPDGKIWALTARSVALFADDKWTIFQKGQGLPEAPSALVLDAAGRPWIWDRNGVAVYDNGSWRHFVASAPVGAAFFSLDARGWLWQGVYDMGLAAFDGETWSSYSRETKSLSTDKIYALTTDSLGRVWVGTTYGLSVFDGSQWQTYRMDNSDLVDNRIGFIVVERDGPVLPPTADKEAGSVTGKLPLRGKRVEICAEAVDDTFFGETPCAGQPFSLSTRSDEEGYFVFENVPAGFYYLFGETNNGWAKLIDEIGFGERILVKAGEQYDLGQLQITQDGQ